MSVYVDDMNAPYKGMKMVHMLADSDAELHAMAAKIDVARRWYQAPPAHDSHYDICLAKKALAIAAGAIPITLRQSSCMNMRRRETHELGLPEESEAWARNFLRQRREERTRRAKMEAASAGSGAAPANDLNPVLNRT